MIIAFIIALCLNKCKITGLCSWEYLKIKTNKQKYLKQRWNEIVKSQVPIRTEGAGVGGRLTLVQAQHPPRAAVFFRRYARKLSELHVSRLCYNVLPPPSPSMFHARATVPLGGSSLNSGSPLLLNSQCNRAAIG